MPFSCRLGPASIMNDNLCVVICEDNCTWFNVYKFEDLVEWKILRLVWIGFHKNSQNKRCYISLLPKDIVNHVTKFVGNIVVDETEKMQCVKI